MKKAFWVTLIALSCAVAGTAQDFSKVDVFGGYSYLRSDPGLGLASGDGHGWEASAAYNVNKWFSLKADVDGHYCCDQTMHNFLFGPQISFRGEKVTPFVHGLVGGSHGTSTGGFSTTVMAFALGGGLDIKWTDRVSLRLAQVDYLGTRYGDATQNNLRVSAGIVIHFGRK